MCYSPPVREEATVGTKSSIASAPCIWCDKGQLQTSRASLWACPDGKWYDFFGEGGCSCCQMAPSTFDGLKKQMVTSCSTTQCGDFFQSLLYVLESTTLFGTKSRKIGVSSIIIANHCCREFNFTKSLDFIFKIFGQYALVKQRFFKIHDISFLLSLEDKLFFDLVNTLSRNLYCSNLPTFEHFYDECHNTWRQPRSFVLEKTSMH
ncbi:hypothetical protein SPBRAN_1765 [uncultured Candidatus Thioglobus sp.]|nr:hypothetical protein SPBRAN_1765 [uncultured Candidatus Thioglobus sp.]